jgi:hypothetical protein
MAILIVETQDLACLHRKRAFAVISPEMGSFHRIKGSDPENG